MSAGGGYYAGNGQVGTPRARYGQRLPTDGQSPSGRPYGQVHGYHLSQDTMHTAGSDSTGTGPWTNSTEPSSENSSIENNANGKYLGHNGQNGYGRQPTIDEDGYGALPQPARRPIALGNSGPPPGQLPSAARPEPEKKKGWLKRRFSKKD
ncbi:hypothetical protein K470DRAFT_259506 [Piedraia hortae CBS 480.64]|uniref:Uncharacterized protein n=1 Tax=Piedraia hortae CBS 480.64 TaxID=1314780 RepID=A0A6A7BTY0_9PEZI|nr:hypothetical protein K470DRAFT_259506 [Piedraia hortae CBS 480.64]